MRHYALLLTLAFLKMALNKKVHFRDCCGLLACQLNGKKCSFGIFLQKSNININICIMRLIPQKLV